MKTQLLVLVAIIFILPKAPAQSGVVCGYSEGAGAGGSSSASMGQVFFTYHTSTNGSVSEGVQQAYPLLDDAVSEVSLYDIAIYPNPTRGVVSLHLPEATAPWRIEVSDLRGRKIESFEHPTGRSQWTLPPLSSGAYLFSIFLGNTFVERYTLLKTQ